MRAALDKLSLWLCVIAGAAICAMMLAMTGDAIARKIVGSIPGAFHTSIALMAIVMFLPQAYAQMRRAHVAIDIVTTRLSPKTQAILGCIAAILGVFVFGVLTWAGGIKAWECTLMKESWVGITYYPSWPFRWFVPLGIGILTLQLACTAIDEFRKVIRKQ